MNIRKIITTTAVAVFASVLLSGTGLAAKNGTHQHGGGGIQPNHQVEYRYIDFGSFDLQAGGESKFVDSTFDVRDMPVAFGVRNEEQSGTAIKVNVSKDGRPIEQIELGPNSSVFTRECNPPGVYRLEIERNDKDAACSGSVVIRSRA